MVERFDLKYTSKRSSSKTDTHECAPVLKAKRNCSFFDHSKEVDVCASHFFSAIDNNVTYFDIACFDRLLEVFESTK